MCDHMQGLSLLFLSDQHHKIGIIKLFRLAFFQLELHTMNTGEVLRDHLSHFQMTGEASEAKTGADLAKVTQQVMHHHLALPTLWVRVMFKIIPRVFMTGSPNYAEECVLALGFKL